MMNKEKYKQAFSAMQLSDKFSLEEKNMKTSRNKLKLNRLVAVIAACVLIMGSATVAYATDFCGIQRAVQLWIHGEQTEVTIQFNENGRYNMDYVDAEGDRKQQGGGGVAFDENGKESPLTDEELLQQLNSPEVNYEEDGSVWIYYFDQKIDITDKFEDGVCYAKLSRDEETLYMTIKYQNGWSTSQLKYQTP